MADFPIETRGHLRFDARPLCSGPFVYAATVRPPAGSAVSTRTSATLQTQGGRPRQVSLCEGRESTHVPSTRLQDSKHQGLDL